MSSVDRLKPIPLPWKDFELLAEWLAHHLPQQLEFSSEDAAPPAAAPRPRVQEQEHPQAARRARDQKQSDAYYEQHIAPSESIEWRIWPVLYGPRGLFRSGLAGGH